MRKRNNENVRIHGVLRNALMANKCKRGASHFQTNTYVLRWMGPVTVSSSLHCAQSLQTNNFGSNYVNNNNEQWRWRHWWWYTYSCISRFYSIDSRWCYKITKWNAIQRTRIRSARLLSADRYEILVMVRSNASIIAWTTQTNEKKKRKGVEYFMPSFYFACSWWAMSDVRVVCPIPWNSHFTSVRSILPFMTNNIPFYSAPRFMSVPL